MFLSVISPVFLRSFPRLEVYLPVAVSGGNELPTLPRG